MPSTLYLLILVGLTGAALVATTAITLLRSRRIACQAKALGLQYSHPDRFLLARRVALKLPIPGTADVVVRDVAYATTPRGLLCIMTASFTIGSVGRRQHLRRVCATIDVGGKVLENFQMLPGEPTAEGYTEAYKVLAPLGDAEQVGS